MKRIMIDLGCGKGKKNSMYLGIDNKKIKGADFIFDLELSGKDKLPFEDSSVDRVYTRHFLEHLKDPIRLIEEVHRVLKKNSEFEIIVPHWSWYGSHTFMHKSFFHSMDFDFFDVDHPSNYYTNARFRIVKRRICYKKGVIRRWAKPIAGLIDKFLNMNLMFSEQFLVSIFTPTEIRIVMRKV